MIHVVLLSGGSGTRLWPLSNSARSKQFLKVLRNPSGKSMSMVQRTMDYLLRVPAELDVTIASAQNQESAMREQVPSGYELVLEPSRRDTAPAILLACAHLAFVQNASLGDSVVVMPIDAFAEQGFYDKISELAQAVNQCDGIVLLGVQPENASTKYGYIVPAPYMDTDRFIPVERFEEKPTERRAEFLISQGAMWNCGVFAFKLEYALNILSSYCLAKSFTDVLRNYETLPKQSFDYEVVEKEEDIHVVCYEGLWKDLGTWDALTTEMENSAQGRVVLSETSNVHAINETNIPMVVTGLRDAVVVATQDGMLVCDKSNSGDLKDLVVVAQANRPMYEKRYWGEYRVLDNQEHDAGMNALTKELVIQKGKQLSYQRHLNRREVWTIIRGEGEVVIDGIASKISAGSVIDIKPMQLHAVRAFTDLHIIEVQLGSPLVEEDIERFGNYWS